MGFFDKIKKIGIFNGFSELTEDFYEELEESLVMADLGAETTMEEADVLYGVTMQEKGVSRMLTINLNDVEKELNIK